MRSNSLPATRSSALQSRCAMRFRRVCEVLFSEKKLFRSGLYETFRFRYVYVDFERFSYNPDPNYTFVKIVQQISWTEIIFENGTRFKEWKFQITKSYGRNAVRRAWRRREAMDFDGASERSEFEIFKHWNKVILNYNFESIFPNLLYFSIEIFRICKFSVLSLKESGLGQIVFSIVPCIAGFLPYPSISIYSCIGTGVRFRSLFENFFYIYSKILSVQENEDYLPGSPLISYHRTEGKQIRVLAPNADSNAFQEKSGSIRGKFKKLTKIFDWKGRYIPHFYLWWYHFNGTRYHFFAIIHSSGLSRNSQR